MRLGIAICTFNRVETLKETVLRIRAHTRSDHDLIVVDDGSSDRTWEEMKKLGVDILSTRNRGIAWNKNKALFYLKNFARSDAIILIEDDTFPVEDGWEKSWVEAIGRWGHISLAARFWNKDYFHAGDGTPEQPYKSTHVSAQCAGFSSECLEVVGFMDSRFRGWGMEHVEHTSRLIKAGFGGEPITTINSPLYYLIDSNLEVLFREDSAGLDDDRKKELIARNMQICSEIGGDKVRRDPWMNNEEMAIFLSDFNSFRNNKIYFNIKNDENGFMGYNRQTKRINFVSIGDINSSDTLRLVICFYDGFRLRLGVKNTNNIEFLTSAIFQTVSQEQGEADDLDFDVVLDTRSGMYLTRNNLYMTCDKARDNICTLDRSQPGDWEKFYLSHIEEIAPQSLAAR